MVSDRTIYLTSFANSADLSSGRECFNGHSSIDSGDRYASVNYAYSERQPFVGWDANDGCAFQYAHGIANKQQSVHWALSFAALVEHAGRLSKKSRTFV